LPLRSASALGRLTLIALASIALAAACTGVSTIGSGDAPFGNSGSADSGGGSGSRGGTGSGGKLVVTAGTGPGAPTHDKGGISGGGGGVSGGGGGVSGGGFSMAGKPELGGMGAAGDGGGMGGDAPTGPCLSDLDCPAVDVPCQTCTDGSYACQRNHCDAGQCVLSADRCPAQCQSERDCPLPGLACTDCGDGTHACPSTYCLLGTCEVSFPGCNNENPCDGLVCGTQCKQCTGSGCAPGVLTYCGADGQCEPGLPQCGTDLVCRTAADCGDGPPNCVACGNDDCAAYECSPDGFCVFKCPLDPHPECEKASDCPITDRICQPCLVGSCSIEACVNGICERVCPAE